MEILLFALQLYGTVADTIALTQFIASRLKESGTAVDDLFKQCFNRAVIRNRGHLAHFVEGRNARAVVVDHAQLHGAMRSVQKYLDPSRGVSASSGGLTQLAECFRDTIILPGHSLTNSQLDSETAKILANAFEDFFSRLPTDQAAINETELGHIIATSEAHEHQTQLLGELAAALKRVEEKQQELAQKSTYLDPAVIRQESIRPEHRNPFRIVKAEDFDHDYDRLASLFREPSVYDELRGPDNLIIAGGRGCGKSMILRSLSAITAIQLRRLRITQANPTSKAPSYWAESGLDYFGVYIKLARGYFHEWSPDCKLTIDAAVHLFQHVFNMMLLRGLIDGLVEARNRGVLRIETPIEQAIVQRIATLAGFPLQGHSFSDLLIQIVLEDRHVAHYLGNLRLGITQPVYSGCHTSIHNFMDECCRTVLDAIQDLRGCRIFFLLDEYENLADFQQKVVNTLAKLRPLSLALKVATRALGIKSVVDLQGEPIQRPRDYQIVELDYDIGAAPYRELLRDIARKRLEAEAFSITDICLLLPEAPKYHPWPAAQVHAAVKGIAGSARRTRSPKDDANWNELLHQWDVAAIFRLGSQSHSHYPRTYAGFDDFADLSSGIISNFLELCKLAFYMAEMEGLDLRAGKPIPGRTQSEAVYLASKAYFECVERNIEDTGPAISRFVLDLADIFREKLHHHPSEPEAARLVLKDPAVLEEPRYARLALVLDDSVRWSVFHTVGQASAYFPKHKSDVRSNDYILNRLLAPILRVSPRPRWRTTFSAEELLGLIDHSTRQATRNELRVKHSGVRSTGAQPPSPPDAGLFHGSPSTEVDQ